MINPKLTNKTVLITGANHGIGAVAAEAFAQQGARVFLSYYRDTCSYSKIELADAEKKGIAGDVLYRAMQQKSTDGIIKKINGDGGSAYAFETDLGKPQNIEILFEKCEKELGPVDILINNHTYCVLETFDPKLALNGNAINFVSAEIIENHFRINAKSYALMIAEYTKRFLKRNASWGRIINISTDAAHAHPGNISYAASKHAIESYSRSAAIELGKYGITVNIIAPGPIQTGYIDPKLEESIIAETPMKRIGIPKDISDVMIFLASDQAKWLTGQLMYVGGGWRMHQ